jgi:O-antigen ligase/polysaccharide polymerase Wzy-like membrane protein
MQQNVPSYQLAGPVPGMGHAPPRRLFLADRHTPPSAINLCVALATAGLPAVVLGIVMARYGLYSPWARALAALTVYVNIVVVLRDLRYGLALFIVAAGLSPKLPGIYDNLRVEDMVFVLVFGVWSLKALQRGSIPLVHSPIVLPFLLLTLMSVVSTVWGGSLGLIPDLKYSLFLQAKRIEYFLIFWVVATTIRDEAWLRLLMILFVVSGALAGLYGLTQATNDRFLTVTDKRVMGPDGENYNTLSGYLVVCIGAGLAVITGFRHRRTQALLVVCTAIAGLALLLSYSREGYVMLVGTLLVFGFTRHRWILLGAGFALVAALVIAEPVRQNAGDTIHLINEAQHDDMGANSLTARYRGWEYRWDGWFSKQPVVGNGVGAVPLTVDNEYLLRACEGGVIGFLLFLWWLMAVWRQIARLLTAPSFPSLLAIGSAAGFIGLIIQALVAASFTTIRTMEPFWFLLGLLSAAGLLYPHPPRFSRPDALGAFPHLHGGSGSAPLPLRPEL